MRRVLQLGILVLAAAQASAQGGLPPQFSKSFAPDPIGVGQTSTLTFTIDDSIGATGATSLDFTDTLPFGLVVATPPNAAVTCTGGTLTAAAGSGTISYTGGSVPAGSTCTVSVDVLATSSGQFVNTSGNLTSSAGNSGPASDTLTVNPQPVFGKAFAPNPIQAGAISTLEFTIDNTASTVDATDLDFSDTLPAGLAIASPPNASTTCTGGTLTAPAGGSTIGYTGGTVAAGASCTVSVDVVGEQAGSQENISGDLTSSLGNSGTAQDTLVVNDPPARVPAASGWGLLATALLLMALAAWRLGRSRPAAPTG